MRYIGVVVVIVTMILFAIPVQVVNAQGPTATPTEQMHDRDDLLAKIAPKEYVRNTPAFQEINLIPKVGDATIDGASWGLTFLVILGEANVQFYLLGILIALLLVFWIRKFLVEQMKKRPMSPFEAQFRVNYKQFRGNVREFRDYRRGRR